MSVGEVEVTQADRDLLIAVAFAWEHLSENDMMQLRTGDWDDCEPLQAIARHRLNPPVGMVLVPREPTQQIVDAMEAVEHPNNHAAFYCDLYAAAIEAAQPSKGE